MRYEIVFGPGAAETYKALTARLRAEVRDSIELHLRHEPIKTSKSRIKRLKGIFRPQYRLRVGEIRIYYDVSEATVEILGIVQKSKSDQWLKKAGEPQ
jgi:mRNA-degrading endonuclease RelE of RelBE toxin-antitoxin system